MPIRNIALLMILASVACLEPAESSVTASAFLTSAPALTPAQQSERAARTVAAMDAGRAAVRRQLELARSQRDVVKVLCLNDKLNQIDVLIRSARERLAALSAAASRDEVGLADHEFAVVGAIRERFERLLGEANACIGEEGISAAYSTCKPVLFEHVFPPSRSR